MHSKKALTFFDYTHHPFRKLLQNENILLRDIKLQKKIQEPSENLE